MKTGIRLYYQIQAKSCRATMRANALEARSFIAKQNTAFASENDLQHAAAYFGFAAKLRECALDYEKMARIEP